jgi:hypothetical protein
MLFVSYFKCALIMETFSYPQEAHGAVNATNTTSQHSISSSNGQPSHKAHDAAFFLFTILAIVALIVFALIMSSSDSGENINTYTTGNNMTNRRTHRTSRPSKAIWWLFLTAFPLSFLVGGSLLVAEDPTRIVGGGFLLAFGSSAIVCCWPLLLLPSDAMPCGWFAQYNDCPWKRRQLKLAGLSCFVLCLGFTILAIYYGKTRKYVGYYSGPMRIISPPIKEYEGCKYMVQVFWGLEWGCPQSPHTRCNTTAIYSPSAYDECFLPEFYLEEVLGEMYLEPNFYEENTFPTEQPPWENKSWPQLMFHGDCKTCMVLEASYHDQFGGIWDSSKSDKIKLAGALVSSIGAALLVIAALMMVFVGGNKRFLTTIQNFFKATARPIAKGNKRDEGSFDGGVAMTSSDNSNSQSKLKEGGFYDTGSTWHCCLNCFNAAFLRGAFHWICGPNNEHIPGPCEKECSTPIIAGKTPSKSRCSREKEDVKLADPESIGSRSTTTLAETVAARVVDEEASNNSDVEIGSSLASCNNSGEVSIHNSTCNTTIGKEPNNSCGSVRIHSCTVCLERKRTHLAVPCHHLCLCDECASELHQRGGSRCPICNNENVTFERVYF